MFFVCLSPVLAMPPSVSIPINGQKTVIKQLRINIWYFSRPYFHGTHITEIHLFNTYELICVVRIWWPDLLLSTTIQAGRNGSPVLYTVLGYLFYFIFKFCCCCCCWCSLFHKIYNNVFVFSARRWKIWRACCHRDISWDFMKVKMTQTQHSASIRICVIRKKMCMKDAIALFNSKQIYCMMHYIQWIIIIIRYYFHLQSSYLFGIVLSVRHIELRQLTWPLLLIYIVCCATVKPTSTIFRDIGPSPNLLSRIVG